MATLADSLVSSSARKLPVRARADLSARRQRYLGQTYWIVKDPVGLNYYRFHEEEYAILQMIDGQSSLDEIKDRFEAEFPPQKITLEELQSFLGQLHRSGLIVAGVPGQGRQLRKRRDERRRREIFGAMTNVLCIRFKGFDPERILNWMYPLLRWLFSPIVLAFCAAMCLSALALVLVEFEVFRSKLPGFYQFFSPTNAILLAVTLGVTKVIHEFGHGLSCKHFGGECHEIGVMILVLTPCLYCNVSDSWMLPNKWHRAAIGMAGIFIEVTMAAFCTFIWWFTEPGLLHYLCLNVIFICSVSTVLFNANPLLRYDGYYVLSDVVEIPNLRQKASSILTRKMGEWFLGLEPPEDPFLPQRNQALFAIYSVAAVCYRWLILASILMFLYKVFEPYGLKVLGQAIAAFALYGLLIQPIVKLVKYLCVPGRIHKVKQLRMFLTLAALAAMAAVIFFLPLPYHVMSALEIQALEAETVFVSVPGLLVEGTAVTAGQHVEKDQLLGRLQSIDLDLQISVAEAERNRLAARLKNLREQRRFDNPEVNAQIPEVEKALFAAEEQLHEKFRDRQRLELRAPRDGFVFPPPWTPSRKGEQGQLPGWSATPLEPRNIGSFLQQGTQLLRIGDRNQMEAVLVIDQADVDFVAPGQRVEIKLDELPNRVFRGEVGKIAGEAMTTVSRRLSATGGGDVPSSTDPTTGEEKPQSPSYQASVSLTDEEELFRIGLLGRAKIHVRSQTLWQRFWRVVTRTFTFEL